MSVGITCDGIKIEKKTKKMEKGIDKKGKVWYYIQADREGVREGD